VKPEVRFRDVRGKLQVDLKVVVDDEDIVGPITEAHVREIFELQTVVIRDVQSRNIVAPHPSFQEKLPHGFRIEAEFQAISTLPGDLLHDMEKALSSSSALIHSCHDFTSPETCEPCRLLHRIKNARRQTEGNYR
jgi:hypothetical protein